MNLKQNHEISVLEKDINTVNIIAAVAAKHPEVTLASHSLATSKGLASLISLLYLSLFFSFFLVGLLCIVC